MRHNTVTRDVRLRVSPSESTLRLDDCFRLVSLLLRMRAHFKDDSMANSLVDLGFVEPVVEAWRLRSSQFPSKAGGRPAWLSETGLPGSEKLACRVCGRPCAFLLQLYAPTTEPYCFHRSLYLFCCRQPTCHRPEMPPPFRVFRNHLPRKNETYSYDPPPDAPTTEGEACSILRLKSGGHLCRVCGCLAPKTCSKCHSAHYCSKDHQVMDWKFEHKKQCSMQPVLSDSAVPDHGFLFPEYEIVTEPEELGSEGESDKDADDVDFEKGMEAVIAGTGTLMETQVEKDLEAFAKHETKEDQIFEHFKKKIAPDPKQILRYCRNGNPLWISGEHVPQDSDIPDCSCGAKRIFEFQVMPQLLSHLNVDRLSESIDWGTLAVFTCAKNCNQENQYAEEFLWKQAISTDSL